jgi:predicted component of type VI protein secretion system
MMADAHDDAHTPKGYVLYWAINNKQLAMDLPQAQSVTIGRGDDCDVTIADNTVSRQHARLNTQTLELTNLSKTNPLFIVQEHDEPIELTTDASHTLKTGQNFLMGGVHLRLIALSEEANMVICWNCGHKLSDTLKDCPWCGITLAFGKGG